MSSLLHEPDYLVPLLVDRYDRLPLPTATTQDFETKLEERAAPFLDALAQLLVCEPTKQLVALSVLFHCPPDASDSRLLFFLAQNDAVPRSVAEHLRFILVKLRTAHEHAITRLANNSPEARRLTEIRKETEVREESRTNEEARVDEQAEANEETRVNEETRGNEEVGTNNDKEAEASLTPTRPPRSGYPPSYRRPRRTPWRECSSSWSIVSFPIPGGNSTSDSLGPIAISASLRLHATFLATRCPNDPCSHQRNCLSSRP